MGLTLFLLKSNTRNERFVTSASAMALASTESKSHWEMIKSRRCVAVANAVASRAMYSRCFITIDTSFSNTMAVNVGSFCSSFVIQKFGDSLLRNEPPAEKRREPDGDCDPALSSPPESNARRRVMGESVEGLATAATVADAAVGVAGDGAASASGATADGPLPSSAATAATDEEAAAAAAAAATGSAAALLNSWRRASDGDAGAAPPLASAPSAAAARAAAAVALRATDGDDGLALDSATAAAVGR